jgi:hypothetical protein
MKTLDTTRWTQNSKTRICNLCSRTFVPLTAFDRYCPNCKSGSDLLKFAEWLPEVEPWAVEGFEHIQRAA